MSITENKFFSNLIIALVLCLSMMIGFLVTQMHISQLNQEIQRIENEIK
jgi:cell division protein FtsL